MNCSSKCMNCSSKLPAAQVPVRLFVRGEYLLTADEPDGETTYNMELGNVTLHFFKEEWDEFLKLMKTFTGGSR